MKKTAKILTSLAGLLVVGLSTQAHAATYLDTYIGGSNPGGYVGHDVVANPGDHRFDIDSMNVTRSGDNLNVVINTNYSGANIGTYGTNLGDLFFGTLANYNVTNNITDTFVGHESRFSDVFHISGTPATGSGNSDAPLTQGGSATLLKLNGTGTDVVLSHASGGFRQYQAVGTTSTTSEGVSGSWDTSSGQVSFNLVNFFISEGLGAKGGIYASGFTLAWAMTCSNDIIFDKIRLSQGGVPQVPLPAGGALLLSGLMGLGLLGRKKAKRSLASA